ncbi:MAG: CDP-alcohol phosphatidyltransferase family protein [Deltaproteobacteria bacterium]|nr:CDP-alcohol phosphatidyltransferase family protein [Deltaproteobacteria bacterium]
MAGVTGTVRHRGPRRLTLSNGVTLLRLAAVPFFFAAIMERLWGPACALFWLAVATDYLDGRIARARGESSPLGGLLDHASDASFVVAGLAALALGNRITPLLPLVVAIAFAQYVLDSRSLAGEPLRASGLGRWNGILYFVPLGIVATREMAALSQPSDAAIAWLGWALVVSTTISIADRAFTLLRLRRRRARARSTEVGGSRT